MNKYVNIRGCYWYYTSNMHISYRFGVGIYSFNKDACLGFRFILVKEENI